jgi:hypothetical protein
MDHKIFCIGDSRTGTMSLHRFLTALGLRSVHNPIREANQTLPLHENAVQNWDLFKQFIDESGYQAFSDYPTRYFFKELIESYPDAYFILSKRRDLAIWQKSMTAFFSQYDIKLEIDDLSRIYEQVNADIVSLCSTLQRKLLVIDIDGLSETNSAKIKSFLGIESPVELGWENKSSVNRSELLSDRAMLYDTKSKHPLQYIESICAPGKAMLSEYGWTYLVNDTNQFLHFQFGLQTWGPEELGSAKKILETREALLNERGVIYKKFAIPEKSVIYREFLPKRLHDQPLSRLRPATMLSEAALNSFHYLDNFLIDAKSYGHLYFRGDSHPNWLGAYFVYLFIAEKMNRALASSGRRIVNPVPLSALKPELASFDGDLSVQLNAEFKSNLEWEWGVAQPQGGFESLVRFALPTSEMRATQTEVPPEYRAVEGERKTICMTHADRDLPRAVVFRDSTSDYVTELLGQHFSQSVFIWKEGLVFEDVIEREKPDIVLHIMAERFLRAYPRTVSLSNLFSRPAASN